MPDDLAKDYRERSLSFKFYAGATLLCTAASAFYENVLSALPYSVASVLDNVPSDNAKLGLGWLGLLLSLATFQDAFDLRKAKGELEQNNYIVDEYKNLLG